MQIYKYYTSNKELVEYTTDDVLQNNPCYILGCGLFYPLTIKEYLKFTNKYSIYFMFNEEMLDKQLPKLNKKQTFLDKVILYNGLIKASPNMAGESEIDLEMAIKKVIKDLEDAFSMVTHKQIKYNDKKNIFSNKENNVVINDKNFIDVRQVVSMQNLIKEPIIYEDEEYAELMAEARRQKNKKNGGNINISEMVAYVKGYDKSSYEEIYNQNILQLYADYKSMQQMELHRTMMNFKLVSGDVPDVELAEKFIDDLYRPEDDSDLLRDASSFDGKIL